MESLLAVEPSGVEYAARIGQALEDSALEFVISHPELLDWLESHHQAIKFAAEPASYAILLRLAAGCFALGWALHELSLSAPFGTSVQPALHPRHLT